MVQASYIETLYVIKLRDFSLTCGFDVKLMDHYHVTQRRYLNKTVSLIYSGRYLDKGSQLDSRFSSSILSTKQCLFHSEMTAGVTLLFWNHVLPSTLQLIHCLRLAMIYASGISSGRASLFCSSQEIPMHWNLSRPENDRWLFVETTSLFLTVLGNIHLNNRQRP